MTPAQQKEFQWHCRFLRVAEEVATWSKDPDCKVGAILVEDRRILSTGYNGYPRGILDVYEDVDRDQKLAMTVHAEMNAILNAMHTTGATLYSTKDPCVECCKAIIQAGLASVVLPGAQEPHTRWEKSQSAGQLLLCEADVRIIRIN